ncbi:MAG: PAS domain S-box protein [Halodesulfurarchaeum sp.]
MTERGEQTHDPDPPPGGAFDPLELAPLPYQVLDEDGIIVAVNTPWLDTLGYDREVVTGTWFGDLLTEDSRAHFQTTFSELTAEGAVSGVELSLSHADGHVVDATFDGRAEYDDDGAVTRAHCQFTDITSHQAAARSHARTDSVLTTLLETLPVGVLVEDERRDIIAVNQAFCDLFEIPVSPADLLGVDCAAAAEDVKEHFENPERFIESTESLLEDRERVLGQEFGMADGRTLSRDYVPYTLPEGDANLWLYRDVTERTERARNLQVYKQAVEGSTDMLAAAAMDNTFYFANPRYREFHDIPLEQDLTDLTIADVIGAERFEGIRPQLERVREGEPVSFEMQRTNADGEERTLDVHYYPLRDRQGHIQGDVAALRDVTERKERERRLSTLISNLPGVVYRCRNERGWPMEMVSGRCEELTGYRAEEIEGGELSWGGDIIHPDDRDRVWESVQEAIQSGDSFTITYRIRTKDGAERCVWEQGRPVRPHDASSVRLEGFITDITERRELREELRDAKERYESLFNSIQDAILVADTDRRIIDCNPAFSDLFGYDLAEIEGEKTRVIYEDEAEFERVGQAIADDEEADVQYTVRYQKRSGQVFPGETTVFRLRDGDDEVVGFIGLIRDISDREDRIQQLKALDRVLQHNFANDMNVIEGYARMIAEEEGGVESVGEEAESKPEDMGPTPGWTESTADRARKILEAGSKLRSTVQKEREITKFLSNPPPARTLDIARTVEKSVSRIRERYPNADISVSTPEEATVTASLAIGQAIEELVENGVKHADVDRPEVELTVAERPDTVAISVADHGPRIPEMERDVLIGEEALGPLYHGSGLGLWLVNLVVRRSDGTLEFAENEPRGNVVTVFLPKP